MTDLDPSRTETATQQEAGRTCPFCRFPLKAGIEIIRCEGCHAPYHADCWTDNAGCAVLGCSGAPAPDAERPRRPDPASQTAATQASGRVRLTGTAAPAAAGAGATAGSGAGPRMGGEQGQGRGRTALAVAIGALAVAIVVLAVALSRGDSSGGDSAGNGDSLEQVSGVGSGSEPSGGSEEPVGDGGDTGAPAIADDEANRQEIRDVLYRFHEDILAGDYGGAWALMSHRKQQQKLEEDGYGGWRRAQATLRPYLDPDGLDVTIQALDASTGVARVDVTGMHWSDPRASCSEWSGITWMKYENGSWHYDPGYSTTAERERLWSPRASELLGVSC